MAVSTTSTWERALVDGGATRPTVALVGGAILQNDTRQGKTPPKDGTHPYAEMFNQLQLQIAALGATACPVRLTIDFAAGVPFIDREESASLLVSSGSFVVVDVATGITGIEWLTYLLPPLLCDPVVGNNDDSDTTVYAKINPSPTSGAGYSGITVKTRTGGTLANTRFTVHL